MNPDAPTPNATSIALNGSTLGGGRLFFLSGPCVLETRELTFEIAGRLKEIFAQRDLAFVFKASFDKANRSSLAAGRGPGLEQGLGWLADVRSELSIPVLSDVHLVEREVREGTARIEAAEPS